MKTEEEEWGREGEKERERRTEGGENKERNKRKAEIMTVKYVMCVYNKGFDVCPVL